MLEPEPSVTHVSTTPRHLLASGIEGYRQSHCLADAREVTIVATEMSPLAMLFGDKCPEKTTAVFPRPSVRRDVASTVPLVPDIVGSAATVRSKSCP